MTSRHGWFALALCVYTLLVLAGNAEAATTSVVIVYDPVATTCYQNTPGTFVVDVAADTNIAYTAQIKGSPTLVQFELQFAGTGPFVDTYNKSNATTPVARGPNGAIHGYQVVIVNGNKCTNARQLGIIMR